MATDKSEPKVGLIFKVAAISIVSLIGLRMGLVTYFHFWEDKLKAEANNPVGGSPDLAMVRANEKSLTDSPMPIANAMKMMSSTDRMRIAAVMPQHPIDGGPDDMRAVTDCWSKMPCDGGGLVLVPPTPPVATDLADGGAGVDGGKKAAAVDAGAVHPAPHNNPGNNNAPVPTNAPVPSNAPVPPPPPRP